MLNLQWIPINPRIFHLLEYFRIISLEVSFRFLQFYTLNSSRRFPFLLSWPGQSWLESSAVAPEEDLRAWVVWTELWVMWGVKPQASRYLSWLNFSWPFFFNRAFMQQCVLPLCEHQLEENFFKHKQISTWGLGSKVSSANGIILFPSLSFKCLIWQNLTQVSKRSEANFKTMMYRKNKLLVSITSHDSEWEVRVRWCRSPGDSCYS